MTKMAHWVGKISCRDLTVLAAYRDRTDWVLLADGQESYWLKVPPSDEECFRKLPLLGRWMADQEGRITREGKRIAEAQLPSAGWQALASHLPIGSPPRGAPGMPPQGMAFQLVADDSGHAATGLLCRNDDLASWASHAFVTRIECLRFARCEDDRAFVVGTPLPPLPGGGFYRIGRLWLPCGWNVPDSIWPELLEEILGLGRNRMALFHPDGSYEELDEENLVPATRAAVRNSISI